VPAPVEQLRQVPLFADLDRRELQSLASSFKERTYSDGQVIASEGSGGVGFFVIDEGNVVVSVRGEERNRLGPGNYFGEIALIDDGARTATVTAQGDLRCYGMTSWEFRPVVETNSTIAWKLLQTMAKRLREAEQRSA